MNYYSKFFEFDQKISGKFPDKTNKKSFKDERVHF